MKKAQQDLQKSIATTETFDHMETAPLEKDGTEPFYNPSDESAQKRGEEPRKSSDDANTASDASSQKTPEPKSRKTGTQEMQIVIHSFE